MNTEDDSKDSEQPKKVVRVVRKNTDKHYIGYDNSHAAKSGIERGEYDSISSEKPEHDVQNPHNLRRTRDSNPEKDMPLMGFDKYMPIELRLECMSWDCLTKSPTVKHGCISYYDITNKETNKKIVGTYKRCSNHRWDTPDGMEDTTQHIWALGECTYKSGGEEQWKLLSTPRNACRPMGTVEALRYLAAHPETSLGLELTKWYNYITDERKSGLQRKGDAVIEIQNFLIMIIDVCRVDSIEIATPHGKKWWAGFDGLFSYTYDDKVGSYGEIANLNTESVVVQPKNDAIRYEVNENFPAREEIIAQWRANDIPHLYYGKR